MSQQLYSVEQVADLLGLHVKTVRGYVRDGRLTAVRIGKQYRISAEDLQAFTGQAVPRPARETVNRRQSVEVSCIVRIDAIDPTAMSRLSNTLVAAANSTDGTDGNLRVESVYDEERGTLKIILLGSPGATADLLVIVDTLLGDRR